MNPKIIEDNPISICDLRKEMKKVVKRDETLTLRSQKTQEYLDQFVVLKDKDYEALEKELTELEIPRMKDLHVKKILDTLPTCVEELKVILQGYALTISKENMQKIIAAVEKYNKP
ncbi:MAG: hypothetical protein HGA85_05705 [Nanoarchaeota archaeon]|nr:hypothetical protein [Nanoarchaeota archaeon]